MFENIVDHYWSNSELRQAVLKCVSQQIEQEKRLYLENPESYEKPKIKESSEKLTTKDTNKRKFENLEDTEKRKPKKAKPKNVPPSRIRAPRETQARKICARPGCEEVVAAVYCSSLCRTKHIGVVVKKEKTEEVVFQNKTEKKEYIAKLFVADIKAMAGLLLTFSQLQRWFVTAAKNNLTEKEKEEMDWTKITSEPEILSINRK